MRFDCGIKLYTRRVVFCLPEGVAMAHNSYTLSIRGLPSIYTRGPCTLGVHIRIRQTTRVHGITI